MNAIVVGGKILTYGGGVVTVGSGGSGSAPTNVQLILQGGNTQGENEGGHTPSSYTQPNHQSIGWGSVSGATQYNIYRSITTTPGTNGSFSSYANVSASTAASNYSTYVSNATWDSSNASNMPSGFKYIAPGINCAWQDTAATGVVNPTVGPNGSNVYYGPLTGYAYYVTAVVGGVESAASNISYCALWTNGVPVFMEGTFQSDTYYQFQVSVPTTPLGFSQAVEMELSNQGGINYINAFSGACCPQWNLNVSSFNYMNVNIYPTSTVPATTLGFYQEVDSDLNIQGSQLYYFGSAPCIPTGLPVANQWNAYKWPLYGSSGLMNPSIGGGSLPTSYPNQPSFYKTNWSNWNGGGAMSITMYAEFYLSVT